MIANLAHKSTILRGCKSFVGRLALASVLVCALPAADRPVDIYSVNQLAQMVQTLAHKQGRFASQDLAKYSNHYTILAVRHGTGAAELHEHEADFFIIESGQATLIIGGKIVDPRAQKNGETRGTSIQGGERHQLQAGDIVHIPAGTPHQLLIETSQPFAYFVLKVTGQ